MRHRKVSHGMVPRSIRNRINVRVSILFSFQGTGVRPLFYDN
jgi:hypothetical protein